MELIILLTTLIFFHSSSWLTPLSCGMLAPICGYPGIVAKLLFVLSEWNEGPVGTSGGDIREGWVRACLDLLGSSSAPLLFRPEDLEVEDGSLWNISLA